MTQMDLARKLIADERDNRTGFLDLGNLGLTELPVELFELTHLHSLNLGSWYQNEKGEYRESSNSGWNSISVLPTALKRLENLARLSIHASEIINVEVLGSLPSLQSLDCSWTQVSDLTPLTHLSSLQSLDCSGTRVSDLTPLTHLSSLQSLGCSGTPVSDLTPLTHLSSLQSLGCWGTQVSDLTPLTHLSSLQSLDCWGTQVSDLTPLIGLQKLLRISANSCRLGDLPAGLIFKKSLEGLYLNKTSIPSVPPEILSASDGDNCLARLRDHLTDLKAGTEEVREAKLIALGNGRVGKTQICRRLRGLPYDKSVPSTHGITVTSEPWAGSSAGELLNIWDFGGQDIYHGTHTLFMKTRAIFLVAWHPEFEQRREQEHDGLIFRNYPLSYWLEYVRTLGRSDSPVIVVQSQCDRAQQEIKQLPVNDEFVKKFPSLKPCWYSAEKNRGRAALDEAIAEGIDFLRQRDGVSVIGKGRMRVLRQLEKWRNEDQNLDRKERRHRTLTQTEFHCLCQEKKDVTSPESLLEYLHNLGVVFYQKNLFDGLIILDQSWALDAVYAVFERKKSYRQVIGQGGRFTRTLLELMVWREYSEAEQRLFLSLMQSCGICFVFRKEDKELELEAKYIAPDLLPEKKSVSAQLDGRWDDKEEGRRLEYEYEFLHPGLMRGLICDAGEHAGEAGVYWKYGVWVYEKDTGCRATIEQEMMGEHRGRITARIQGQRYEELAKWIRERIQERNQLFGYPDLQPIVDEFDEKRLAGLRLEGIKLGLTDKRTARLATLPPSIFPRKEPQIFVSYAWGDTTLEGIRRKEVVDQMCSAIEAQGVEILRDCEQMRTGDRISEFMTRLTQGDFIITVISDKYLRAPNCMYELFGIYRNCGDDPERFLARVIPLILPDARVKKVSDRIEYAGYWKEEKLKIEEQIRKHGIDVLGKEDFNDYRMTREFAHNVSDILKYLNDKLVPRDFDRMAEEGFQEVLALIGKR